MNNEEKILQILMEMQAEQRKTNERLDKLEQGQAKLEQGQAKLEQGQAKLEQEMNARFDRLESSLEYAWQDIALVEKRIKQHEREYHEAV